MAQAEEKRIGLSVDGFYIVGPLVIIIRSYYNQTINIHDQAKS